jgi:hypothetical protein
LSNTRPPSLKRLLHDFLDANGDPVAFSRAAVAELYSQFPAVRDQVDACIGNRANFLGDSAKS